MKTYSIMTRFFAFAIMDYSENAIYRNHENIVIRFWRIMLEVIR